MEALLTNEFLKKPLIQKRAIIWSYTKRNLKHDIEWIVDNTYLKLKFSDIEIKKSLDDVKQWTITDMINYMAYYMNGRSFHGYHFHWAFENGSKNDICMKNDEKIKFIICGLFLTNYYISPWEKRSNYPWKSNY